MTIPPMTDDEAEAFRLGIEWMRGAVSAMLSMRAKGYRDRQAADSIADLDLATQVYGEREECILAMEYALSEALGIVAPRIQRLGFGVTGEG